MDHDNETNRQTEQLSAALGWFSIALGVSELAAPRTIARAAGLPTSSVPVLRVLGAREIGHGISIPYPQRDLHVYHRDADGRPIAEILMRAVADDGDRPKKPPAP